MELQIILFLVVAAGSLSEGVKSRHLPLHGVNGHRGKPRASQSFDCTRDSGTKQPPSLSTSAPLACPPNMTTGNCSSTCHANCQGITSCGTLNCEMHPGCICHPWFLVKDEHCVPPEECGCYLEDDVIAEGGTQVTGDCSQNCTCSNQQLNCTACDMECGSLCSSDEMGGERNFLDCYDAYKANYTADGFYTILPTGWTRRAFPVYCDMTTNGGGWTVFHRREVNSRYGIHTWNSYKNGFRSYANRGIFWLGNEKLYRLTSQANYKLRVDLITARGARLFEEYSLFKLANEEELYTITELGESNGTAGDGMRNAEGQPFSTYNRDNDGLDDFNCALYYGAVAWWYSANECDSCQCYRHRYYLYCKKHCTKSNLNINYNIWGSTGKILWNGTFIFVKSTEMKVRPLEYI